MIKTGVVWGGMSVDGLTHFNVCAWCPAMDSCPILVVFPPNAQCSWDRLWTYRNHVQDKVVTDSE